MEKLRVAIVGCGRIAQAYKKAFKELHNIIEPCFAIDINLERAQEFAKSFASCQALTDYRDCLDKNIDILHIATPHYLHKPIALDAMEHKVHVLTEKPIAIYLHDADEMIKRAHVENVKLGVIFQTRFIKGFEKIKEAISQGRLGKILGARSYLSWKRDDSYYEESDWKGTWDKEGGGVLIDQAIHSIDRVQDLLGEPVVSISASMHNRNHKSVEVEDVAEAFIHFESGAVYQLYACNCYPYDAPIEIEVIGEKGKVGLLQDVAWMELEGEKRQIFDPQKAENSDTPSYWGTSHVHQLMDFYKSVLNKNHNIVVDGVEGRKALEIVRGIYHSAIKGEKINLPFIDSEIRL